MRIVSIAAAAAAALALAQPGAAGPGAIAGLLPPKVVRAEIVVVEGGVVHDYRIDRGRVQAVADGSITLLERDGSSVTVPVAPDVEIRAGAGGRLLPPRAIRRLIGLSATTIRDRDRPAGFVQVAP